MRFIIETTEDMPADDTRELVALMQDPDREGSMTLGTRNYRLLVQVVAEVPEPDQLTEHVRAMHPRLTRRPHSGNPDLAERHAGDHYHNGGHSHHHGPNAGPHARPVGWRTGGDVTMITEQRI